MKSLVVKMAFGLLFAYIGFKVLDLGMNSTSNEDLQKYEALCAHTMETTGYYDSMYMEIKVAGAKINTADFKYAVDGAFYEGQNNLEDGNWPTDRTLRVWYDVENKSSYSTKEPCAELAIYKKKHRLPAVWLCGGGLLLMLFGLLRVRSAFFGLIRGVIKPEKR